MFFAALIPALRSFAAARSDASLPARYSEMPEAKTNTYRSEQEDTPSEKDLRSKEIPPSSSFLMDNGVLRAEMGTLEQYFASDSSKAD